MSTNLMAIRLNKGLSIPALAKKARVPDHVIYHAEKGGVPRPVNALKIARALDLQVTDLWPVEPRSADSVEDAA